MLCVVATLVALHLYTYSTKMKIKNRKAKMAVLNGNGASEMNTIGKTDVFIPFP